MGIFRQLRTMRPIRPTDNHGVIRIRFNLQNRKYHFNLTGLRWASASHRAKAQAIAAQITADVENAVFDPTLEKYRPAIFRVDAPISLLDAWDLWVDSRELSDSTKACHYDTTRKAIVNLQVFRPELAAWTHNARRGFIRSAVAYAKEQGHAITNPYAKVRVKKAKNTPILPFLPAELTAIVSAVKEHWPHYQNFIQFLMVSGCRFGEVAALQGYQIKPDLPGVLIDASYSRNHKDHKYYRKSTKTNNARTLKSSQLVQLAVSESSVASKAFVFTTVTGLPIARGTFTTRIWKRILVEAGLEHRGIHTLRHTALSLAIENRQLTIPQAATMAGHKSNAQITKTYAHVINQPEVPDMVF